MINLRDLYREQRDVMANYYPHDGDDAELGSVEYFVLAMLEIEEEHKAQVTALRVKIEGLERAGKREIGELTQEVIKLREEKKEYDWGPFNG